jgi:crotonobetainyl-CoA:carnitine CoA-transferase CaiB-like acyl-CoA transferase
MNQTVGPSSAPFLPLDGIRVLDFSKVLAGPLCTQYLGDMGADVIKVEPCSGGDDTRAWPPITDGEGTIFLAVNRNKRSLALDLKSPEGLAVCHKLAARSDVVVESFGPGVAERLGIGCASLRSINPRLIYCSISGYGTRGPMKEGKGYDLIAQAFTGMLSMTGEPGGPPARSPFSPVDQGTGLHAVVGIMGALMQRARTGAGMQLETSLFDTAVGFLGYFLQGYWQRGTEPVRPGSGHESLCPYQAFETQDTPLILGIANDTLWRSFCDLAGHPDLARDPRFATGAIRVAHRPETVALVQDILRSKTREQWMALLEARGIPCSPVHSLGELSQHPHTEASDMVLRYHNDRDHEIRTVATPLRANGLRPALRRGPPRLGEHSLSILAELGFDESASRELVDRGVVKAHPDVATA